MPVGGLLVSYKYLNFYGATWKWLHGHWTWEHWVKIPASFLSKCLFLCDLQTVKDPAIPETTAKSE